MTALGPLVVVWRAARAAAVAYLVVLLALMLLEESFLFFPSRYPQGDWRSPAGAEDVWFQADDGQRLHGWHFAGEGPPVLFCHGNGGNLTHRAGMVRAFQAAVGRPVFVFDYRGYGRSEGRPTGAGVVADGGAARRWLAARHNIGEGAVVLWGESLGGAVAVQLATEGGAAALILDSTFSSLADVAAYYYPWAPVRWLMRTRFESAAAIARYRGPVFLAHSPTDTVVPYRFGRRLFEAAGEPREFFELGVDHNDYRPSQFYRAAGAFLRRHAGR